MSIDVQRKPGTEQGRQEVDTIREAAVIAAEWGLRRDEVKEALRVLMYLESAVSGSRLTMKDAAEIADEVTKKIWLWLRSASEERGSEGERISA